MGSSPHHLLGMLLVGCGPAFGQSAASASPSFQERIKEVARTLQNQPRLNDLSEQDRIDRVEFVVGNTLFILLHEPGHVHFSKMQRNSFAGAWARRGRSRHL
jgi:hypothetical protein